MCYSSNVSLKGGGVLENSILHVFNVFEVSNEKNRIWNVNGENIQAEHWEEDKYNFANQQQKIFTKL